jgi:hypothetical protein
MNQRIKELASQCWDQRLYGRHFDQEMFAELIVRECANVIANDDLAKDCGTLLMDSYAKGMRYSAHLIREHFGVI